MRLLKYKIMLIKGEERRKPDWLIQYLSSLQKVLESKLKSFSLVTSLCTF